jgi:hypothetical protein
MLSYKLPETGSPDQKACQDVFFEPGYELRHVVVPALDAVVAQLDNDPSRDEDYRKGINVVLGLAREVIEEKRRGLHVYVEPGGLSQEWVVKALLHGAELLHDTDQRAYALNLALAVETVVDYPPYEEG